MSTSATISTPKPDRARAPGKVILSGEHAVVYGAPALVAAVERYTEVWFTPVHRSGGLRTVFENLSQGQLYPLDVLKGFKQGLDQRFEQFMRGEMPVQQILQRPDDLAVYTMASLLQNLPVPGATATRHLPVPGQLHSRSDLPLGAGMGSSAAVIAATFVLYEHLLERPQTLQERFERVRFCERLQHGQGSSVDAAAVVFGGINRVQSGQISQPDLAKDHPLWSGDSWYWVLHGAPASSTGECVSAVRAQHGKDTQLWHAFETCTQALQSALETGTSPDEALRENQRLLEKIGVVPAAAQRFVQSVNDLGGAAKICGAGAVRGDHAGVVLVHLDSPDAMERLMADYPDRRWEKLRIASQGAQLSGEAG
ncbi:mevalonate kinase [Actibacterium atlanticum]|uniref:mevalonate kinase n=1 Tax=Actibacterium atlanticum TaxID=1461693 RepID=A0A058ZLU7_9RHOB|nr:GHMP kinase [Actibacterium atlanticum]KCV81751.1 mevalonate kinase [Actibacterium atlanticum]